MGKSNVVNLSVHKNTKERRKLHEIRKVMRNGVRELSDAADVSDFVLFTRHTDGAVYVCTVNTTISKAELSRAVAESVREADIDD